VICRQLQQYDGHLTVCLPKTAHSARVVALDRTTVAALRAHRVRQEAERAAYGAEYNRSGYLFTNCDADPMALDRLSRIFRQLAAEAGLPPLLVSPDTVLRWHRDLIGRRHATRSRPTRPGRPRTVRSIRLLVLRLAAENPGWGYRRLHGELLVLGVKVAPSAVWEILKGAGIDPAPERLVQDLGRLPALAGRRPAGL
jgi:transposase